MAKRGAAWLLMACLLAAVPLWAAKEISVDFDTGKETEWVDEVPPETESAPEVVDAGALQRELVRLRKLIRLQQQIIGRQQAVIKTQQKELRRQRHINRGLEQLCRACR
jgi:hypothetical protein